MLLHRPLEPLRSDRLISVMAAPERFPPDDPREWLRNARSDLAFAKARIPGTQPEHHCFHAQQAAEKAIKALMIARGIEFPYVHDLKVLLTMLAAAGEEIPEPVPRAEALSRYAGRTRYPGHGEPVTDEERREALTIAVAVVEWARERVRSAADEEDDPLNVTGGSAQPSLPAESSDGLKRRELRPPAADAAGRALDPNVLDEIVRRIVEVAQPEKIILFGSAARGAMGPHSDVDLLIVKDGEKLSDLQSAIYRNLHRADSPLGEAFDVIVVTPAHVERYRDSHPLVIKPALREGMVVYEAA